MSGRYAFNLDAAAEGLLALLEQGIDSETVYQPFHGATVAHSVVAVYAVAVAAAVAGDSNAEDLFNSILVVDKGSPRQHLPETPFVAFCYISKR